MLPGYAQIPTSSSSQSPAGWPAPLMATSETIRNKMFALEVKAQSSMWIILMDFNPAPPSGKPWAAIPFFPLGMRMLCLLEPTLDKRQGCLSVIDVQRDSGCVRPTKIPLHFGKQALCRQANIYLRT